MLFLDFSPTTVNKILHDYNKDNALQLSVPVNTYPYAHLCTCKNIYSTYQHSGTFDAEIL